MPISVVFCNCGGTLEKEIDFKVLEEKAKKHKDVSSVEHYTALCKSDDLKALENHLKTFKPKSLVIIGCSKRICLPPIEPVLKLVEFDKHLVEVVNLREHCAWVHPKDVENATEKSLRMLEVAIEKARGLQPVEGRSFKIKESALVIGGGIAGIQAALDLAHQGFKVYLLEKTPTIGGVMALLVKTFPTDDCAICIEGPKMAEVMADPNIETITYADIIGMKRLPEGFKVEILKRPRYVDVNKCVGCGVCAEKCPVKVPDEWGGRLGNRKAIYLPFSQALPRKYTIDAENCLFFTKGVCRVCEKLCEAKAIDFDQKPEVADLEVGSIILATGFNEFDVKSIPKYGFGKYKDVITQLQLARVLDPEGPTQGKLVRFSDGKKPKRITMVQCVGSRDPETNPYCSRYCCMAAIKNATMIKIEQDPEAEITILYKDIRAAGKGFEEYYLRAQERFGIKFIQGEVNQISENSETRELVLEYTDIRGEIQRIISDFVVLSAGIVPSKGSKELMNLLGIKRDKYGFVAELDEKVGSVETNVPGIYSCGCCQSPKDIPESVAQGSAAAARAALHMGKIIEKDLPLPTVDRDFCGKCRVCIIACPFDAITFDEKNELQFEDAVCQSCGLCVSGCPAGAIEIANDGNAFLHKQVEAAIANPRKISPLVLAFCCDECGYTLLDTVGFCGRAYPANIIPIYTRCLGSVSASHILKALALGADGVMLIGCQEERCHFVEGMRKTRIMVGILKKVLKNLGISPSRIKIVDICGTMVESFVESANNFVKNLGCEHDR